MALLDLEPQEICRAATPISTSASANRRAEGRSDLLHRLSIIDTTTFRDRASFVNGPSASGLWPPFWEFHLKAETDRHWRQP
jgi:hypothetical protein